MIFQNIDIHDCSELEHLDNGAYAPMRVPSGVHEHLTQQGKSQNKSSVFIDRAPVVLFKFYCDVINTEACKEVAVRPLRRIRSPVFIPYPAGI